VRAWRFVTWLASCPSASLSLVHQLTTPLNPFKHNQGFWKQTKKLDSQSKSNGIGFMLAAAKKNTVELT